MGVLVTLQEGKDHLRLTTPAGDAGDADLQLKLDAAEAVIVDYLKVPDPATFSGRSTAGAATTPRRSPRARPRAIRANRGFCRRW
jgi:hypothetical protein